MGHYAREWCKRAKDILYDELFYPPGNSHLPPYVNQVIVPLFSKLYIQLAFVFDY